MKRWTEKRVLFLKNEEEKVSQQNHTASNQILFSKSFRDKHEKYKFPRKVAERKKTKIERIK